MTMELDVLESQLADAMARIRHLEEQMEAVRQSPEWRYLVYRPHRWRRQLSVKGRNMTVGQLVSHIRANRLSIDQAGSEFDLPVEAVQEALAYYEANRALIELEATEERRRLAQRGLALEPKDLPR